MATPRLDHLTRPAGGRDGDEDLVRRRPCPQRGRRVLGPGGDPRHASEGRGRRGCVVGTAQTDESDTSRRRADALQRPVGCGVGIEQRRKRGRCREDVVAQQRDPVRGHPARSSNSARIPPIGA